MLKNLRLRARVEGAASGQKQKTEDECNCTCLNFNTSPVLLVSPPLDDWCSSSDIASLCT
jgi:hypothetical protein